MYCSFLRPIYRDVLPSSQMSCINGCRLCSRDNTFYGEVPTWFSGFLLWNNFSLRHWVVHGLCCMHICGYLCCILGETVSGLIHLAFGSLGMGIMADWWSGSHVCCDLPISNTLWFFSAKTGLCMKNNVNKASFLPSVWIRINSIRMALQLVAPPPQCVFSDKFEIKTVMSQDITNKQNHL